LKGLAVEGGVLAPVRPVVPVFQTGVHSPGEFRVNGPLSNLPEFAAAFGCKAGDPMVREQRIRIW
jgi:predicted metalloendopeptidase